MGAENAEDYRCPSDRKTKRLDLSERCNPEIGRHPYRKRRNECYYRIFWSRNRIPLCYRESYHLQYGCRSWSYYLFIPVWRTHGYLFESYRKRLCSRLGWICWCRPSCRRHCDRRTIQLLRPCDWNWLVRTRTLYKRAVYTGCRYSHLWICRKSVIERLPP